MINLEAQARKDEAQAKKDAELRRQIRITNRFVLFVLVAMIVGPIAFSAWFARQYPSINAIAISNMQAPGETALCPGDPLTVAYDFKADGAGVLVRDATTWNVTPPKTLIFSTSRRFILDGPVAEHVVETWHVPTSYRDPETDTDAPVPPGAYRRYVAIAAVRPAGVVAIDYVDFTIRADCEAP